MVQPNIYLKFSCYLRFILPDLYVFHLPLAFSFFIPLYPTPSLFTIPMQRSSICFLLENNKMYVNEVNYLLKNNVRGGGEKRLDPLYIPLSIL